MKIYRPNDRCNIVGEQVRLLRKKAGLSQEELAAKIQLAGLDMRQQAVSRIETGSRVVPDYELLYLCRALHVPLDVLLPEIQ